MSFDNIKLEKGLYTMGKSFTDALEAIDPSENYRGTSLEGLDAYERQLKRFDIKVSGKDSDTISKFFKTTDSAVLFPEYISRAVKVGMERNDKVEKLIATTTEIDSLDYRSIRFADPMNICVSETAEGEVFGEYKIELESELTPLKKYGTLLKASYEAIKFQKLDVFSIALKHIGETISNDLFMNAIQVLIDNERTKTMNVDISRLAYESLVDIWIEGKPFEMNTLVANKFAVSQILKCAELRDANAGLDFHGTGRMITPFGAEILLPNMEDSNDFIIAIDKNNALEMVQAGGIVTEFDKLIDRQIECAAISTIVGFAPIYADAAICIINE